MKKFTKITKTILLLLVCCFIFTAGCSKITGLRNSLSGDEFTKIAEEYGLEVEEKTASSLTTYIAQGNNIYSEFYIFESTSYVDASYGYLTDSIEAAFSEDDSAVTDSNDGAYPSFQMSSPSLNAAVSVIGNTMIYVYSTSADGIDSVDDFLDKTGY